MKPHLPVSLFRALLLITMATATTAWSAVTVLTEDTEIKNQSSALMTTDSESMGYTSADSNARRLLCCVEKSVANASFVPTEGDSSWQPEITPKSAAATASI